MSKKIRETYVDSLDATARHRYFDKFTKLEVACFPYDIPTSEWVDNIALWPPVTYPDVYSYLIETPGQFTRESLKAYKSLEAYNYVVNGWVKAVYILKAKSSYRRGQNVTVMQSKVTGSQRLNDKPHSVWLGVEADGTVVAGHCTCMAGLGEVCSHVAAVLFKVEIGCRLGYTTPSCTSQPCTWNQPNVKKIGSAPVRDISFRRPKRVESTDAQGATAQATTSSDTDIHAASTSELDSFLDDLSRAPHKVVTLTTSRSHCDSYCPVPVKDIEHNVNIHPLLMQNVFREQYRSSSYSQLLDTSDKLVNDMCVSEVEIEEIEKCTRKQHKCELWYQYRYGRLTASSFRTACMLKENKPSLSFLKKTCTVGSAAVSTNVPSLMWGREHEQDAKGMYSAIMSSHTNHRIEECGLFVHHKFPFLGASPHGIVIDECCGRGVLECKCPFSVRDDCVTSVAYLYRNSEGVLSLTENHPYYYQVQGQMEVCDVSYADFVVWTQAECAVVRVSRDAEFCSKMTERLVHVFKRIVMPCLLTGNEAVHCESQLSTETRSSTSSASTTHTAQHRRQQRASATASSGELYCVCQKPYDHRYVMVDCDNNECKYKLFHLRCIGLKRRPTVKPWFCQFCSVTSAP